MIVSAKSLGAGTPIGAVTGRAEIMDSAHLGGVGSTYGGSPVACAAAIQTLKMIRQNEFLAHANHLGEVMREVLESWKGRWPVVGDVRGLGPMLLVELVADRETKTPWLDLLQIRISELVEAPKMQPPHAAMPNSRLMSPTWPTMSPFASHLT
jgi:4-aminobutyrate aminotransferase/(S)-3-amino-2-methylpropionate transaminase